MHAGQPERVRLWGIDCPESRQAFGTRAKQFTSQLAFGREVKVVVRDTDRYGRTVGEVILPDGRSLNHELVRAGLAWWYRQYAANDRTLENLEREARAAKRGLWVEADPIPPHKGVSSSRTCAGLDPDGVLGSSSRDSVRIVGHSETGRLNGVLGSQQGTWRYTPKLQS